MQTLELLPSMAKARHFSAVFGTAEAVPWSFYIFSSGGSLNQSWIGSFEPEGCDELALLRHFLA